jgi:hypothetical protein
MTVILFESSNIVENVFGQMILYIQSLNSEGKSGAILFDRELFWLIKCDSCE